MPNQTVKNGLKAENIELPQISAVFRCILVPFKQYGHPKESHRKSSCDTFSISVSRKN